MSFHVLGDISLSQERAVERSLRAARPLLVSRPHHGRLSQLTLTRCLARWFVSQP